MSFKVYQQFEPTDIVAGRNNTVSSGFFPGGEVAFSQSRLTTSSVQTQTFGDNSNYDVLNGLYYTNVYDNSTSNPQLLFSISYGDLYGSGSISADALETKAVYSQYKNILLGIGDANGLFNFLTGSSTSTTYESSSRIYVLNFSSQLQKNQIDAGQWSISLVSGSTSISIIDDSCLTGKKNQNVYQVIRGTFSTSAGTTVADASVYESLGLFYPKSGVIILNPNALIKFFPYTSFLSSSSTPTVPYSQRFFGLLQTTDTVPMRIRKSEIVPSIHYWVRVKNSDFNFSNNPTYIYQESDGEHTRGDILDSIVSNPASYVTTVGLYNDLNELVAVAKLSRPTRKDFTSEMLIRIRLDC